MNRKKAHDVAWAARIESALASFRAEESTDASITSAGGAEIPRPSRVQPTQGARSPSN